MLDMKLRIMTGWKASTKNTKVGIKPIKVEII